MPEVPRTSYDVIPYPSGSRASSHPDRLATLATLLGMQPAPVERCRVLELGCGDGGNLLPMASTLSDSEFVGVDLAASAVARGAEAIRELGLTNVSLVVRNIMDLGQEFGTFDYVIAHGVYSWVPPAVRDRILGLIHELMRPQGVAFVSYNAMPGGHFRQMLREMMRFHVAGIPEPEKQLAQARSLLAMLARAPNDAGDAYRTLMNAEITKAVTGWDHALYHDDLAEVSDPFYFTEFIGSASEHALQFLSEADFFEMSLSFLPEDMAGLLGELGQHDLVRKEQYLDFLKCRRFRQTLLCHAGVTLNRAVDLGRVRQFRFASPARPVPDEDSDTGRVVFQHPNGSTLATDSPAVEAAMRAIGSRYPGSLDFDHLVAAATAAARTPAERGVSDEILAEALFRAFSTGVSGFVLREPQVTFDVGERPTASAWARWQSVRSERVTNLFHETVGVSNDAERRLLPLLDGTRDVASLAAALGAGSERTVPPTEDDVRDALRSLARAGLLVS
jgi:methyltransferase-like protein/ubiquinone/menaquinone biosynthesis C-methylase UbiE